MRRVERDREGEEIATTTRLIMFTRDRLIRQMAPKQGADSAMTDE